MSVAIDPNRPYSDEEKDWLLTRSHGADAIRINDRQFGHLSDEEKAELRGEHLVDVLTDEEEELHREAEEKQAEEDGFHPDDEALVAPLKLPGLKAQLKKLGLETHGDKDDLQLRLLEHLDAQRYPERYVEDGDDDEVEGEDGKAPSED